MGNTYMPKPENRYPNNVSGFEHIWELDMLNQIANHQTSQKTVPNSELY